MILANIECYSFYLPLNNRSIEALILIFLLKERKPIFEVKQSLKLVLREFEEETSMYMRLSIQLWETGSGIDHVMNMQEKANEERN